MTDARLVECQDCGYRWESSASSPRCSKADCGRSRNVEPVEDEPTDEDDEADDLDDDPVDDPVDDSVEQDDDGDDGGFTASFKSREQTADHVDAETPDLDDDLDDEDDDGEQDGDDGKDADPAEDVPDLDPEQLETGFDLTFDVIANQRGEHWRLDDDADEAEKLAKAWTPVMNHYAPVLFRQHTEVGVALIATVSIIGPRLAEDKRLAEQEAERERAARDGEPGEPRESTVVEDDDAVDDAQDWGAPDDEPTETQSGWANA